MTDLGVFAVVGHREILFGRAGENLTIELRDVDGDETESQFFVEVTAAEIATITRALRLLGVVE